MRWQPGGLPPPGQIALGASPAALRHQILWWAPFGVANDGVSMPPRSDISDAEVPVDASRPDNWEAGLKPALPPQR